MFALINDIERYPRVRALVHGRARRCPQGRRVVATLGIKRGPLQAEFTTRNLLEPDRRVLMQFVSGPFRVLEGLWTLTPLGDLGCRVELEMRFEFANRVSGTLFEPLFEDTAASLVDAFVSARARARRVARAATSREACRRAYSRAGAPVVLGTSTLAEAGTVGDALDGARARRPATLDVPWDGAVGIFGELCDRDARAARRRPDRDLSAAQGGPEGVPAGAGTGAEARHRIGRLLGPRPRSKA